MRAVGPLERDVHLEPAVVGRVRVVPRPLVAVDAEPRGLVWNPLGLPASPDRATLPEVAGPDLELPARRLDRGARGRRARGTHQELPAPGLGAVAADLLDEAVFRHDARALVSGRCLMRCRQGSDGEACE